MVAGEHSRACGEVLFVAQETECKSAKRRDVADVRC